MVQPLDARLGNPRHQRAAALMEDGTPILIVDVEDMVRSVDNLLLGGDCARSGGPNGGHRSSTEAYSGGR